MKKITFTIELETDDDTSETIIENELNKAINTVRINCAWLHGKHCKLGKLQWVEVHKTRDLDT